MSKKYNPSILLSKILGVEHMNHIAAKHIKTCYDDTEYYWIIDDTPITVYIDQYVQLMDIKPLLHFGSLLGLLPAWSGELIWQWENDFIWELVDSHEDLNVPILVCEDDCGLSCIVIVAHIRKTANNVYWDKIGLLDHSNMMAKQYQESGILCLEAYTNEDWEKYGDNIATEQYGSSQYWQWVSENCYEEHMRQLRNYIKPYMQKEENIQWIWEPKWQFKKQNYNEVVEQYRKWK